MADQKMDEEKYGEGLMEEHPFYRNRKLKIFILLLTIVVFILPIIIIANMIMGKPAFFFF